MPDNRDDEVLWNSFFADEKVDAAQTDSWLNELSINEPPGATVPPPAGGISDASEITRSDEAEAEEQQVSEPPTETPESEQPTKTEELEQLIPAAESKPALIASGIALLGKLKRKLTLPPRKDVRIKPHVPAKRSPPPKTVDENEPEDENAPTARDYLPIRFSRRGRLGCLGGMMYSVFVICLSVVLACFLWMCAADVLALAKPELTAVVSIGEYTGEPVIVTDDDGEEVDETPQVNIDEVATALKDAGIIEYPFLFKFYSKFSHAEQKIDPGSYELTTHLDYRAIVTNMQKGGGASYVVTLTFPEGWTVDQIFSLLEENEVATKKRLYEAAANYSYNFSFVDAERLGDETRLEGMLFPDTYDFYENEQPSSVVNKFLVNFAAHYNSDMLYTTEHMGYTLHQMLTIASMIESEAANDTERALIASVIYNRLAANRELQIDATIQYVLDERVPVLTEEQTQIDSPYNTYLHKGLPPGPISNPGAASIAAALAPESTNYYYYALDSETHEHQFFTNYDDFAEFVSQQDYSVTN